MKSMTVIFFFNAKIEGVANSTSISIKMSLREGPTNDTLLETPKSSNPSNLPALICQICKISSEDHIV